MQRSRALPESAEYVALPGVRLTDFAENDYLCEFESHGRQRPMPDTETPLTAEVFDQLQQAMAADKAGFTELYREYLADAWHTLDLLREAAPHRIEEVRQRAHYLRSSSLVLGARKVARLAGTLEEKARTTVSADNDALEPIAEALREVQTELAERLGNGVIPADKTAAY